jgi:hypothetical protein
LIEQGLSTGAVTFLFTDLEASIKLAQEYADAISAYLARPSSQHQLRPVLQRLCQMHGLDFLGPCQICNRTCQLDTLRAMIRPRRQIELRHRHAHQALTLFSQLADLEADFCGAYFHWKNGENLIKLGQIL